MLLRSRKMGRRHEHKATRHALHGQLAGLVATLWTLVPGGGEMRRSAGGLVTGRSVDGIAIEPQRGLSIPHAFGRRALHDAPRKPHLHEDHIHVVLHGRRAGQGEQQIRKVVFIEADAVESCRVRVAPGCPYRPCPRTPSGTRAPARRAR
jgi:hypothetical protein